MLKSSLRLSWRSLWKNKLYSFINITGLAIGIAVALMIGLWIWDELTYDHYHTHYDRIAQVKQNLTFNGQTETLDGVPLPLGNALRNNFGNVFKYVVMAAYTSPHILSYGDKQVTQSGNFFEPDAPEMFTLQMLRGSRNGLRDPGSILLSATAAKALFGKEDGVGKMIRINNIMDVKVTGVYEDLPYNSTLRELAFMAPWSLYAANNQNAKLSVDKWNNNAWQVYVQLADHADLNKVSAQIRDVKLRNTDAEDATFKPALFLHPMSQWHLYSDFKNGVNNGGKIRYIWMFGLIGIFVLLLACINFMNLSTARSETRAKEIGVRKAIGSLRTQLIFQFLLESVLMAVIALVIAILLVLLLLPVFNALADKRMQIPLVCWLLLPAFALFTGLLAGSYPAFYLSGLNTIKVLKGAFRAGHSAVFSRKALVVLQFVVSIILIISTIVVFRQIRFTKDRPVGYNREGLVTVETITHDIHNHFMAVRNDLLNAGVVTEMAESSSPATKVNNEQSNFAWKGKDLQGTYAFATMGISQEFGKTAGWQITEGRDFSRQFGSDAMGFVINESAKKYMGLKNAIGEKVQWSGYEFTIVGVIKDMVMQSPYEPVKPTIFYIAPWWINVVNIRLKPGVGMQDALAKVEQVFKKYSPAEPFSYKFTDDEFARKFSDEERIGRLASIFAVLAVIISCLGLFGLSSFMAAQRVKEIGIRKVLGASVFNVWRLLSKDFVVLVIIALLIAAPAAYWLMYHWLQHYTYRTDLSGWIFVAAGSGALLIALLTVSYQSISAALVNPVKSLKTE